MTFIVSISQFRQHISDYIAKVQEGHIVILKDEKKNQQVVQLMGKKEFNPQTFGKALTQACGIFTTENHPEWKTKKDVISWVERQRSASDRNF